MLWAVVVVVTVVGIEPAASGPSPWEEVFRTEHFSFHSDPWMNLHHFLFQWARAEAGLGTGRQTVAVPERSDLEDLGSEERAAWTAAVSYYRREIAERSYLFDDLMLRLKMDLAALGGDPTATPPDEPTGMRRHLLAAMPVYLERWWPEHDRANRTWIQTQSRWVEKHEAAYVRDVQRAYGGTWNGVLRVDVAGYANWAGGYTSNGPNHTVIWSRDDGTQGMYGLEILFHEAGHQQELESALRRDLDRAFEASGREQPENLWHAVLFHTAGWITQRVAREEGLPDHEPYAVHEGLVDFPAWSGLWFLLEEHWKPFLQGRFSREEALTGLAGS
jgi:hypothetical protein